MSAPSYSVDYQRLFRLLPDSFLLLRPNGLVLDNSDSHVRVSLLPREQAVGQNIFTAYPSDPESQRELDESHEYVRQHLVPHTMGLLRYDLERPAELGGGTEELYWQITHYPLLDEQGNLEYILQRPQDVTAQVLAARRAQTAAHALIEVQERNQFILESLPVMVWTSKPQGQPDYFNPRWLQFTGKSQEELLTSDWQQQAHPDDLASLQQVWADAIATGQPMQYEYRLRRHDGQYRWILARAVPRLDAVGQVQMWVGSASDIHEQRQLVTELLQTNEQQAALAEQAYQTYQQSEGQRRTYEELFEQLPALIAVTRGPDHRYDFVNTAYQQVFAGRVLKGHSLAEALPEIAAQGITGLLDRVYASGESFHDPALRLLVSPNPNEPATEVYMDITLQRFSELGQPAGVIGFAFEVTDLVHARQALAQLRGLDSSAS
jgi:PAS domain S-box-containing protein